MHISHCVCVCVCAALSSLCLTERSVTPTYGRARGKNWWCGGRPRTTTRSHWQSSPRKTRTYSTTRAITRGWLSNIVSFDRAVDRLIGCICSVPVVARPHHRYCCSRVHRRVWEAMWPSSASPYPLNVADLSASVGIECEVWGLGSAREVTATS